MVKKEDLNKQFSERLHAACLDAGVAGRGLPKRIQAALKKHGISISEPGIWKWLNAAAIPDSTNILALSRWLGVRSEWLEYGRGLVRDDDHGQQPHTVDVISSDYYRVDVLNISASAGKGVALKDEFIETIKSIEYSSDEARLLFGNRPQEHIKLIAVNGDSMSGTFEPRDQIFVDVSINYFDGDGIYIFVLDNDLYVKRLQLQHKRLAVISDNKKYETWYIDQHAEANLNIVSKVLISQSRAYKIHG